MKKQLGKEYIGENEPAIIGEMVKEMKAQVDKLYADKKMLRQIHTKMHGCVKGLFTVAANLPEELKVGVFAQEKSYDAWIRFSNASTKPKPDAKKDIRGMAIKLIGVAGEKILQDELKADTQDFLLMSSETFFSRNIQEFGQTLKAVIASSKFKRILYFLNPKHWRMTKLFMKSNITCTNPLELSYWSTQPYRFGEADKAVKYFIKPSATNELINENTTDYDYLRINLQQTLNSNEISFDFFVQFQTNADTMPIEDPTVPWSSKFQKVGTLKIIKQSFDSEEQMEFGDNLSFNPWHSLPVHQPLGGFNRARKVAYETMSKYRHEKNKIEMFEPSPEANFLNDKITDL